ncbi:MAG: hypothetical protein WBM62_07695, partial [Crocosphaera sp.]
TIIEQSDLDIDLSDVKTASSNVLTFLQSDTMRKLPVPSSEEKKRIIVFSTDPDLTIDKSVSAEWEVQLAKKELNQKTIVMQRNELFSTAIVYDNEDKAKDALPNVRDRLNRQSAFVTSLEQFCPDRSPGEERTTLYQKSPYTFYTCNNSR